MEVILKNYTNVPIELRSLPQWVGFYRIPAANGRMTKKPVNPHTLFGASSTNPETWGTYEQAVSIIGEPCRVGQDQAIVEGIGFVFSPPYCGIDLDGVFNPDTGEINDQALKIVKEMSSYTELSPSGTGLHIIYKGEIHPDWKKKQTGAFGSGTDLEMYQQGRYFTVTGDIWGEYSEVCRRDSEAEAIQNKFMFKPVNNQNTTKIRVNPISLNDEEIMTAARNSRNGMLFSDLYSGNWQGSYNSQSEADMALCSMLAFWFQRDFDKIDNMFRHSGLMREKWDRKQSGSTYGAITIKKAISECSNVYSPETPDDDFFITIKKSKKIQKYYSFDDTGNAQRMHDLFKDKIRYNYNDKRWMIYDKNKWVYDITGYIWKLIDKSMEAIKNEAEHYSGTELQQDFEKHLKKCRSNNTKKALEKEVQHYASITPNELDRHKLKLNTPDGIVDLINFKVSPCDPDMFFSKSSKVSIRKGEKCPLWIKFVNDIFGGNEELIRYIQKAVGYSLTGLTDEQCAFFCYGTGRNGKTTFLDIIRYIFGDYASNIQPETLMIKSSNSSANSDIARLKGARLVTSVEPNEGVRLNEGLLKQLTGDDIVTARKLYGEEFEFRPEFKLWMATNHKPIIRGTDTGIWRRIHLIPFTVQIPEEKVDKKLKEKLMKEIDGIFLWILKGLDLYNKEGLKKPAAVTAAVEEYRGEMDTISRFLEECTVKSFAEPMRAKDLYNAFSSWCDENGEYKLTNTKFGIEMVKRFERKKDSRGWYYIGLKFNDDYQQYRINIGK